MLPASAPINLLLKEYFRILGFVHPFQVLLEIVESRPLFVVLWATLSKTFVLPALAMFWLYLVNALLMSLEIIDGCEALGSCTIRFSTHMFLVVASCMFSNMTVNELCYQ